MLNRALDVVSRVDEILLGIVFIIMFGMGLLAVFMRYILHSPLTWADEMSRYLLVWLTFLGALVATRLDTHIRVPASLLNILPYAVRVCTRILLELILLILLVVIFVKGMKLTLAMKGVGAVSLPAVPLMLVYGVLPFVAIAMALHIVVRRLKRKDKKS